MSSTINDLKTPSSGGGVALDYANPVHSFRSDGASYTVPNDGTSYYLCGSGYGDWSGQFPILSIDSTELVAFHYVTDHGQAHTYISPLRLVSGQTVSITQNDKFTANDLYIFKAL